MRTTRLHPAVRVLLMTATAVVAAGALPAAVGTVRATSYLNTFYAPPAVRSIPSTAAGLTATDHDPRKPTAVVLVGDAGANIADALAPYEIFAATGAYNLYTVAPQRQRVTLTGGLDLVPDLDFDALAARLGGRAPDVVVVPAMPDAYEPTSRPLRDWLARQSRSGAKVLGVCQGAGVVAGAGLLDGRDAATHWFRINGLHERFPEVRWHRGTRYVDDGDIITTGAVLSGIDGALRVIETLQGAEAARNAAAAVGWTHYSAGSAAPIPRSMFGGRDLVVAANLSFRQRDDIGVLVSDGVGEMDLAAAFITYTDASYAAHTFAIGANGTAPVRSRHGLVFLPRHERGSVRIDRLLVPGAEGGFAFDAALRDLARTTDVATAEWEAKTLEYSTDGLDLTGPRWPWAATLLPLIYSLIGVTVWLLARRILRRRTVRRAVAGDRPDMADSRLTLSASR